MLSLAVVIQQRSERLLQARELLDEHLPDQGVVHSGVAMDQNSREFRDPGSGLRVYRGELIQGLPNEARPMRPLIRRRPDGTQRTRSGRVLAPANSAWSSARDV